MEIVDLHSEVLIGRGLLSLLSILGELDLCISGDNFIKKINTPKGVYENTVSSEPDSLYYQGISSSESGLKKQSVIKM